MTTVIATTTPARTRLRHLASATLLATGLALGASVLGHGAVAVAQPVNPHFDPGRDPELACVASGGSWDITESDEIGTGEGGGGCVGGAADEDPVPPVPPVPPTPPTGDPKPPTKPPFNPSRLLPVKVAS